MKVEREKDAIRKGIMFLESECKDGFFQCYLSDSRKMDKLRLSPREIFSSFLILETALKDRLDIEITKKTFQYIKNQIEDGHFYFFEDHSLLPPDIDTTSCCLSILLEMGEIDEGTVHKTVDKIVSNVNEKGIIKVYFGPYEPFHKEKENKVDHVSATNALYLINLINRGKEAKRTEDWVFEMLNTKKYLKGTKSYMSPDLFLYFLSRLVFKFPNFDKRFSKILKQETKERINTTDYPLDLAVRITVAKRLGIPNEIEKEKLLRLQGMDGSCRTDAAYHGTKFGYFGSKAITTAFFLEALKNS